MMKNEPSPFSDAEFTIIKHHMLRNIATEKNVFIKVVDGQQITSIPGAVIAAPASEGLSFIQDYQFHWTRDAAITMAAVLALYVRARTSTEKDLLRPYLLNYLSFLKVTQSQPNYNNLNILGEPKFNINGTLWTGPWGRPQDDGAGLVATVLIQLARVFIQEKQEGSLIDGIYHPTDRCLLKPNLEYIANNWSQSSVGVWEEVRGSHFFRLCVQRRALYAGAELANQLGDSKAGLYYIEQAKRLEVLMTQHWTEQMGYYREVMADSDYRGGGLNITAIMGLVYGRTSKIGDPFSVMATRSMSSAYFVRDGFEHLYKINLELQQTCCNGPLIGRYQNDYYDGDESLYGNPWFLTTNNFAEYYYVVADSLLRAGTIGTTFMEVQFFRQLLPGLKLVENQVISYQHDRELFDTIIGGLVQNADRLLSAVKMFAATYEDGSTLHLSEQVDRQGGQQKSVPDLTWSYSSTISALLAREDTMTLWSNL